MNIVSAHRIYWIVFIIALQGCAVFTSKPPEERVAQRSQERLDLMWSGEMKASYEYTTPGYRSARTWQEYKANWLGVGMWKEAEVHAVDCGDLEPPSRCEATIRVVFVAPRQQATTTYLKEQWLLVEGDWYLYQKL